MQRLPPWIPTTERVRRVYMAAQHDLFGAPRRFKTGGGFRALVQIQIQIQRKAACYEVASALGFGAGILRLEYVFCVCKMQLSP